MTHSIFYTLGFALHACCAVYGNRTVSLCIAFRSICWRSISFRSTLSKFVQSTHSDNIYSAPCTTTIIFTFITLLFMLECIVYMFLPSTLCLSAWQQRDEKWMKSCVHKEQHRIYNKPNSYAVFANRKQLIQ